MPHSEWSDIRQRLARVARSRRADEVFGSNGHGWRLESPLPAAELREVEAQLRVELPAEYRSFLLQVGRGGAGPGYGLHPLNQMDGRWQWEGDGVEFTDLDALAQPFAHTEAFNPLTVWPALSDNNVAASMAVLNVTEEAPGEKHPPAVDQSEVSIGLLYLSHLGCDHHEALVISGPARGQMWADDRATNQGFRPLFNRDATRLGFASWYRRWLDKAEAKVVARKPRA